MIRHGSSFFLSLAFHTTLAILLVFAYKSVISTKKEVVEKKVCIELCNIVEKKPLIASKPVTSPKPIEKPKPIIEPKPNIQKHKPVPKPVVKKQTIKEVPMVVPEIEPVVTQESAKKEPLKEEKVKEKSFVTNDRIVKEQKDKVLESKEVKLQKEYMQEHLAKIAQLIRDNLYYPRRARVMQEEGRVVVKFILAKDATVHSVEAISSKSKILSRAAIQTIQDLSGEFPKPKEQLTLSVPIEFLLR